MMMMTMPTYYGIPTTSLLILLIIAAANSIHQCGAFTVPPHHKATVPSSAILLSAANCQDDVIEGRNPHVATTTTRRNALSSIGCLSLLTGALSASPREVNAASSSNGDGEQPFNVLFTIQLDPSKPDDELSELEIEVRPDWAPLAARRFRELVEVGYYDGNPFFRVLPGFISQFGISPNKDLNKIWMFCDTTTAGEEAIKLCKPPLPDEPGTQPNRKGTLSFATSGKNTRRTQIFINTGNNGGPPNFLDLQGFVPFARVVRGMEENNNVVKKLNGEYGGSVNQGKAAYYGGEYFEKIFPRLSVIREVKIIER